jgi:UDP-3-O-[3-hydroxymyristoyl] glucosamine N-acyltransferase
MRGFRSRTADSKDERGRMTAHTFARTLPNAVSAATIAELCPGARINGERARAVSAIGSLASRAADVLAFCDAAGAAERLAATPAAVVIVSARSAARPRDDQTFIVVEDVRAAFIDVVERLLPASRRPGDPAPGVDARARVDATAIVAPSACIGGDVTIGARTRVGPGAIIFDDCQIGSDCVIGPNAAIGWVGLAYHDRADGTRSFFPHLAGVRIADRVDVGAQTCVCRGMLSHTVIGDDVKIGSLVYVSHGVVVDARAWLSAGTAVAGHAAIEEDALLGIGSVVIDNVQIEAGVLVGGGSVVTRNAPAGTKLYGVPAHPVPTMRRFGPTPRER